MARPSALAVLRLMTSSNLIGCSTGYSAGLAPRKTLATIEDACTCKHQRCGERQSEFMRHSFLRQLNTGFGNKVPLVTDKQPPTEGNA